jgi:hypothetical protein
VAQDTAAALSVPRALLATVALAAAVAGCGSSDGSSSNGGDVRGSTLACLTEEQGLDARLEGEEGDEEIVVDGPGRPRIRFYLTAGEAEAAQFEGKGEGAEQIGAALLYVRPEVRDDSEELLEVVENCLAEQ